MNKIFISYRRDDSSVIVGRIYDRLVDVFGTDNVFKDVNVIPYGVDFRDVVQNAVSDCAAMVVIVGDRWLLASDSEGNRRLDDEADVVRLEIETALQRAVRVVPVLVRGAPMPSAATMPQSLRDLAFRNALQMRNDPDFNRDMDRLIKSLHEALRDADVDDRERIAAETDVTTSRDENTSLGKYAFLSYACGGSTIANIVRRLRLCGVECWPSESDVRYGHTHTSEAVLNAIESASAMVIVLPESAKESPRVATEIEHAARLGIPLFPIRVEKVRPSRKLQTLMGVVQCVDLFTERRDPDPEKIRELARAIVQSFVSVDGQRAVDEKGEAGSLIQPTRPAATSRDEQPLAKLASQPGGDRFVPLPSRVIQTGTSILFHVLDRYTKETCLLKQVPKDLLGQKSMSLAHLRVDGNSIASPILEWEDAATHYEVLPAIEGWTFADIIALNEGIYGEWLTLWSVAILKLVETLQRHDPPLIHCDIKPSNIMVRMYNLTSLVLIDCTAMVPYPAPEGTAIIGTRGFTAPEAVEGTPTLASDIYSAGCTIYAINRCALPPSDAEREYCEKAMHLVKAEENLEWSFDRLVALNPQRRFADAASALGAFSGLKVDSGLSATFKHLILPDGRRLRHSGFY